MLVKGPFSAGTQRLREFPDLALGFKNRYPGYDFTLTRTLCQNQSQVFFESKLSLKFNN